MLEVTPVTSNRAYKQIHVNQIDRQLLLKKLAERNSPSIVVGLDVAKEEIVATLCWPDQTFERPWCFGNPLEIGAFIEMLQLIRDRESDVTVGLEPTGTYGDCVRYALTNDGFPVMRIEGKDSCDYHEIFDGVPSQHDGKDAAIVGELTRFGKGTDWSYEEPDPAIEAMRLHSQRFITCLDEKNRWKSRMEALLARHWPEVTAYLELTSATLPKMLMHYGDPSAVAADSQAADNIRRWGGSFLKRDKISSIVYSAETTAGLPLCEPTVKWLKDIATSVNRLRLAVEASRNELRRLASATESMQPFLKVFGGPTLCSLWVSVGDPIDYPSSGAYLKALGLNLKERSSGKYRGRLKLTKRGPGLGRKALYFWAMRSVKRRELSSWYCQYKQVGKKTQNSNSEHRKQKALTALVRKGAKGLWYARRHQQPFDYGKVFPGRPLDQPRRRPDRRRRR